MIADDPGLADFNKLPADRAVRELRTCCASAAWTAAMVASRPYPNRNALLAKADEVLAALDWAGVREALDAHPRIGERAAGGGREAAWSRGEQSGMDAASEDVRADLVTANRAYEERFGHVFLIFATGRTDTDMLTAARERLGNSDEKERDVVRGELRRIVALRLTKLLNTTGPTETTEASR